MQPTLHAFSRRLLILLIFNSFLVVSCTTTKVITKYDCDTFANNPVNTRTTWSFVWGLVQPKDINPGCDERFNHLNKVVVKNNLGFSLISVISLGLVMPQRVEWCCAPIETTPGDLGH